MRKNLLRFVGPRINDYKPKAEANKDKWIDERQQQCLVNWAD